MRGFTEANSFALAHLLQNREEAFPLRAFQTRRIDTSPLGCFRKLPLASSPRCLLNSKFLLRSSLRPTSFFWVSDFLIRFSSLLLDWVALCSDFFFKILLIGDSGVGKSCLLLRFAVRNNNYYILRIRIQYFTLQKETGEGGKQRERPHEATPDSTLFSLFPLFSEGDQ